MTHEYLRVPLICIVWLVASCTRQTIIRIHRIVGIYKLSIFFDFKSPLSGTPYIEFLHLIGSILKSEGRVRFVAPRHLNSETSRLGDSRFPRARREIAASDNARLEVALISLGRLPLCVPVVETRHGDGTVLSRVVGAWRVGNGTQKRFLAGRLGKVFT